MFTNLISHFKSLWCLIILPCFYPQLTLSKCLDAAMVLGNSHLFMNRNNKLAVIASHIQERYCSFLDGCSFLMVRHLERELWIDYRLGRGFGGWNSNSSISDSEVTQWWDGWISDLLFFGAAQKISNWLFFGNSADNDECFVWPRKMIHVFGLAPGEHVNDPARQWLLT